MNRRSLLTLLLALVLGPSALLAPGARAEDDDDSGSDDSDDSGSDDSGDDGESRDSGDDGDVGDDDRPEAGEDDHDDALRAVTEKDAIPLKQMLRQFSRLFEGTVVDVTLIRGTNSLRYRVKFIDSAGRVRRAYFDAVTGTLVR